MIEHVFVSCTHQKIVIWNTENLLFKMRHREREKERGRDREREWVAVCYSNKLLKR